MCVCLPMLALDLQRLCAFIKYNILIKTTKRLTNEESIGLMDELGVRIYYNRIDHANQFLRI